MRRAILPEPMRTARQALKILAATWITLAVTVSGVPGVVLCIGADGHFSLESAHEGRCRSAAEAPGHGRHAAVELVAGGVADCCGDCVDVALSSDSLTPLVRDVRDDRRLNDRVFQISADACLTSCDGSVQTFRPTPRPGSPIRLSASLLAQRTIVLRT